MAIQTVNPATGKMIRTYEEMSLKTVEEIVEKAHKAFLEWRGMNFSQRAEPVRKAAGILLERKMDFAEQITTEMGKIRKHAVTEVEKCAWVCNHYAEHAEAYLRPRSIQTEMAKSYVTYLPVGVVLAIMPWNFPFWQVFRFAAPALMAGNAVVLKHAAACTGTSLAIERVFEQAGFPDNLFRCLVINSREVAGVMKHPGIRAVTLTGSERTGRDVASNAGRALKKAVLELGGSDPYLILSDNDEESLDKAAEACVAARMLVSGQVCISAKRLIVVEGVREAFTQKVLEKLERFRMGDPMADNTDLGPLARDDLREDVHGQVLASIDKGARLLLGGTLVDGPGFFYPPTLITNVIKGMPAYEEEVFGPVVAVLPAKDNEEAVRIANDTPYGLGAAVFTKDVVQGEAIAANEIEAGICVVNTAVVSDPRLPFGGMKASGYGRELSEEGIREFTNVKTVCVK